MNMKTILSAFAIIPIVLAFVACDEIAQDQAARLLKLQSEIAGTPPDGYLALAPTVLRPGRSETIPVSLFSEGKPAQGRVSLALLKDGETLVESAVFVRGSGEVTLDVPDTPNGDYQIQIRGDEFQETAPLRVELATALFVETDKPIYKPGQDVRIRAIKIDTDLKPISGDVTVQIQDAKGIKVFRQQVRTDDYGMATLTMPLSTEPNLGVWKITAESGPQTAQVDIRVERYVLPKYEVNVNLAKDWTLTDEPIAGTVSAEYSFGKPVRGELEIAAFRYVGQWEEFATFTEEVDGSATFELPPVQYVAGVPAAGGDGNVRLDVTVRERSTGYVEQTTRLLTVADSSVNVRLIPESSTFKPGLPMSVLIVTETPDNRPVDHDVSVSMNYLDDELETLREVRRTVATVNGKTLLTIEPPSDAVAVSLSAKVDYTRATRTLTAAYSPSGSFIHVEQVGEAALDVGDDAQFRVHSTSSSLNFYYEIISRGRVVSSDVSRSPDISVPLTPVMAPTSRLVVYQIQPDSEVVADYVPFNVNAQYPMQIDVELSSDEVRPGDAVDIEVTTDGPAKVGLVAVDRSVFILAENRLNLAQVFAELERLYMQPQVELHDFRPRTVTTRGANETFRDAGLVVLSNMDVPKGKKHEGARAVVEKEAIAEVMAAAPVPTAAPAPTAAPVPSSLGGRSDSGRPSRSAAGAAVLP